MRRVSLCLLVLLFASAGCLHFLRPQAFMLIVPPALPHPGGMVAISGAAEILGALGLIMPKTRPLARWGLIVLLVAVFPANIYMAQARISPPGMQIAAALLWLRLLLQPLMIWWVLTVTRSSPA